MHRLRRKITMSADNPASECLAALMRCRAFENQGLDVLEQWCRLARSGGSMEFPLPNRGLTVGLLSSGWALHEVKGWAPSAPWRLMDVQKGPCLVLNYPRVHEMHNTRLCLSSSARVWTWPQSVTEQLLSDNPSLFLKLAYGTKTRQLRRVQMHLYGKQHGSEMQLAALLWWLAAPHPVTSQPIVPRLFPQVFLGDLLGVTREEVSRRLKYLKESHLIATNPLGIQVSPEIPALLSLAQERELLNPFEDC